jgi:hypothetical protein
MFRLQNELLDAWREERAVQGRGAMARAADTAVLGAAGFVDDASPVGGPPPPATQ